MIRRDKFSQSKIKFYQDNKLYNHKPLEKLLQQKHFMLMS